MSTKSSWATLVDFLHSQGNRWILKRCGETPTSEHLGRLVQLFSSIAFPGLTIGHPENFDELEKLIHGAVSQFREQLIHLVGWTQSQTVNREDSTEKVDDSAVVQRIDDIILRLPQLIGLLHLDVQAAADGDPACSGPQEVVICYPGFRAIMVHRLSHELYSSNFRLAARMLSEWAHSATGIDIHPGATIGDHFFIDHGTGVVIGETCHVGNHVKLYQGVTLGALSFSKDESGKIIREAKRHPTIEDHVVIYASATVLGGGTILGHHSVIGGSVWLTGSVAPYSTVVMDKPRLRIRNQSETEPQFILDYKI